MPLAYLARRVSAPPAALHVSRLHSSIVQCSVLSGIIQSFVLFSRLSVMSVVIMWCCWGVLWSFLRCRGDVASGDVTVTFGVIPYVPYIAFILTAKRLRSWFAKGRRSCRQITAEYRRIVYEEGWIPGSEGRLKKHFYNWIRRKKQQTEGDGV